MKLLEIDEKCKYDTEIRKTAACILTSLFFLTFFSVYVIHYRRIGSWVMDNNVYTSLQTFRSRELDSFFIIITSVGNTVSIIIWTTIVAVVFYRRKELKEAMYFAAVILCAWIMNDTAKAFLKRPRPTHEWLVYASNYSFPSGHSMIFMSFSILLIYFMLRFMKDKKAAWAASTILFILALLVGISRVYVGVHYISDVFGGWSFGGFWIFANLSVLYWLRSRKLVHQTI